MTAQRPAGEATPSPPTPDGVPLLGNGLAFSRNPVEALDRWAALGDVVRLDVPGQEMYLVTGPSLIKQILVDEYDSFTISPAQRETFRGIEDHAVTTTTGERWERLRRALRPAFTRDAMDRYADRMVETPADRPEYAYFPFSGGPRNCIGMHFAKQELTLVVATIIDNVTLDVSIDGPLTFTPSLQLRPEPAIEATVTWQ